MPMDKRKYPPDWKKIALRVKEEADWKCQKCGKQCRRPGEPFTTHRDTLTVAHLNHIPSDVRVENLMAMCAPCHLRYDAKHHAETRRRKKLCKYADDSSGEYVECAAYGMVWCKNQVKDYNPDGSVNIVMCSSRGKE